MERFTVYSNDLKGILSPLFFMPRPENTKGFIELNKIAEINPPRKISNLNSNDLIPYVGLPETGDLEIKKVLKRPCKEIEKKKIIKKGDILFARIEPSILNKKCILVDDLQGNDYAFTTTEFYIVKAKENVNLKFLFYMFFTKEVYTQLLGRMTGSSRRRLDRCVFENLLIPFPDKQTQNRIAALMDSACSQKKQKESEAQQLIDSINDYVLDELGIKTPELKDKTIYAVNSDDVKGKRIDAYYYQPKFEEVENAIKKGKYGVKELKELIKINDKSENIKDYNKINYINLGSVNKNFGTIEEINQLSPEKAPSRARQKIEKGDLLLSGLNNSSKSIAVFDMHGDNFIASTGFYIIKNSKEYNNYYLYALFRGSLYQLLLGRETTEAAISSINREPLLNLKIPLPPLSVQNKIAEEVKRRMQEAERLQKEAEEELEKAKQEVEKELKKQGII